MELEWGDAILSKGWRTQGVQVPRSVYMRGLSGRLQKQFIQKDKHNFEDLIQTNLNSWDKLQGPRFGLDF